MATADWFIHLHGETLGPLPEETLSLLLAQYRVRFVDFAWKEGMTQWQRIHECPEFSALQPASPQIEIPSLSQQPAGPVAQVLPDQSAPLLGASGVERVRRYERVKIEARVVIDGLGDFDVADIGEGGVGVRAAIPLMIGTEVTLRLVSSAFSESLRLTGLIVRHVSRGDASGFGIEFTQLSTGNRQTLQAYVLSKV